MNDHRYFCGFLLEEEIMDWRRDVVEEESCPKDGAFIDFEVCQPPQSWKLRPTDLLHFLILRKWRKNLVIWDSRITVSESISPSRYGGFVNPSIAIPTPNDMNRPSRSFCLCALRASQTYRSLLPGFQGHWSLRSMPCAFVVLTSVEMFNPWRRGDAKKGKKLIAVEKGVYRALDILCES